MKRVGILGGGQLGMMLAESVQRLGAEALVLDPDPDAPARRCVAESETAAYDDADALRRFAARCDVLTYEFENVPSDALRAPLAGAPLHPSLDVLAIAQDRIAEKTFLRGGGFPHVPFAAARSATELAGAVQAIGLPCVVKSARGGYDGKGQGIVRSEADLAARLPELAAGERAAGGFVVEALVEIALEASCIVARSPRGEEIAFPLFENHHRDHILDLTLVPARVSPAIELRARELALAVARRLDVIGLLTVEFFVVGGAAGPELRVNEIAPRPHNSGHVTRRACSLSQFDALARVLLGAPLPEPRLAASGVLCMGNLLGDVWLAQGRHDLDLACWRAHPEVIDVHLYGKRVAAPRRKMGHFIVQAADAEQAIKSARAFRRDLARPSVGAPGAA